MKCKKNFKKFFAILMVYFFSLTLIPFNFLGQVARAEGNEIPTYRDFTPFYLYYAYQYKDKTLLYGDNDLNIRVPKKLMVKDGDNYKVISNKVTQPYNSFYTDKGLVFLCDKDALLYNYESDSLTKIDEESIIENVVEPSLKSSFANDYKDYTLIDTSSNDAKKYVKSNGDILYIFTLDAKNGDDYTTFKYLIDSKGKIYYTASHGHSISVIDTVGDKIFIKDFYNGQFNYLFFDGNNTKQYSIPNIAKYGVDSIKLTKDCNLAYIQKDFANRMAYLNIDTFDYETGNILPNKTLPLSRMNNSLTKDFNNDLWISSEEYGGETILYKVIDESISPRYKFTKLIDRVAIYDDNNLVVSDYNIKRGSYVSITDKVEEPSDLDLKLKTAHESTLGVMKKASSHGVKAYFDAKDGGISDTDNVVAAVKDGLQKDILKTREAIDVLPDDGGTFTNARETFSSILDNYQHPIYERIVTVINEHTEKENPTQKDLNGLRYLIQDIPNLDYKATWSTNIDDLQGILFNKARTLVEKALESKLAIDIENAKKAITELEENEFLTEDINTLISELKGKLGLN
ncbi:hypothetical protein KQI89_12020 [Clostridium sp. MSJ-4]|uniref:Uncharacterized protein n=1 Tax=Clostridium simiarum TaxID=2841506 RepID=A0ABS6F2G4_9CLOT|nr:hypothetical protein [Clostridium simiarum]MBU5592481.1 hypothetical protein [Clostridium simiarum]